MATVKKSKKKKIIIPICIILVIAIVATTFGVVGSKNKKESVTLSTISTDDIIETVNATGDVTAGASREYKAGTVALCKQVYVKVGDEVKKGDVLATFDTSNIDGQVASLQNAYSSAKSSYNNAVKQQKNAEERLDSVNSQIAKLEKEYAKLLASANTTTTKKPSTTKASTTTTTKVYSTVTLASTTKPSTTKKQYSSGLDGIADALTDLVQTITDLTDDVKETNELTRIVMSTIAAEIEAGHLSSEAIGDAVGKAVGDAIKEGIIEVVDSGEAVAIIEAAVKAVDWESIGRGIASSNNVQQTTVQLQLAALYAQQELYTAESNYSTVNTQKQIMDSTGSALNTLKQAQNELNQGWQASIDGIITEVNVVAGVQTSALETGIKLENMDTMVATISLGEYDIHKVKIGMPATIKTAYGTYTGEIATIAPTATGGSSGSILDSVGSMAGISGLSSLTATGAGVKCTVTINNPDENIIVGFDADVEIKTGEYTGVPVVPIESIVLEKTGSYVFLYNAEEETVTKTKIETGAISDTAYEIKSGISLGDQIVATPAADYKETFKVKVVNK